MLLVDLLSFNVVVPRICSACCGERAAYMYFSNCTVRESVPFEATIVLCRSSMVQVGEYVRSCLTKSDIGLYSGMIAVCTAIVFDERGAFP